MSDEAPETMTAAALPAVQEPRRAPARLEADGGGVLAIIPRSLEEASRYAQGLIKADQVPDAFRYEGKKVNDANPSLVLMGVLKVLELNLPPQTGLAFILPLNGRFNVWGDGAWALLQRHGQVADHKVEWLNKPDQWDLKKHSTSLDKWPDDYGVEVSIWRKGQVSPYVGRYTVGDAKRAGLWNSTYRKPWIQHPERMLFNRARAFPMRDGFADALLGLGIAEEALDHAPPPRRRVVDSSALDDDLPMAPKLVDHSNAGAVGLDADVAEYISGLAAIGTLEDLAEYQGTDAHRLMMSRAQKEDDRLYQEAIKANAARYQEIEAHEAAQRRATDEAAADAAEDADDAAKGADAPETGQGTASGDDLFGGDGK